MRRVGCIGCQALVLGVVNHQVRLWLGCVAGRGRGSFGYDGELLSGSRCVLLMVVDFLYIYVVFCICILTCISLLLILASSLLFLLLLILLILFLLLIYI